MNSSSPIAKPTCDGPLAVVVKKMRSPAAISGFAIFTPAWNWSLVSRGSATPCWANTYWVNPLQSKPFCVDPPRLYRMPRRSIAVSTSAAITFFGSAGTTGSSAAGGSGAGSIVVVAISPCGVGNTCGIAPVDAHADDRSVSASIRTARDDKPAGVIALSFIGSKRARW